MPGHWVIVRVGGALLALDLVTLGYGVEIVVVVMVGWSAFGGSGLVPGL